MFSKAFFITLHVALAASSPLFRREVSELDGAAFEEAQQRDDTATRVLSDVQIKTSSGKCLFVDKLSGDFRANLTPIQIADCGSTDGQGWDVITAGKHNDQSDQALIVSTLTQACFNVDTRRAAGDQVNLFSCGGRADGGGEVTGSQLFAFTGLGTGTVEGSLTPQSENGLCLTGDGDTVDVADCDQGDVQTFTFGDAADDGSGGGDATTTAGAAMTSSPSMDNTPEATSTDTVAPITTTSAPESIQTSSPTDPVPVSRAGGTLNPSAVAESQEFDDTATRAKKGISIRASDGRCLSIDASAGDFRENLIPVALADCDNSDGQKFDVVTKGAHNDGDAGAALIVSALTNGCMSFDARRAAGDTVTMFSCGGRADGGGETDVAQLYPFDGSDKIVLEPVGGNGDFCLIAGDDRLDSTSCSGDDSQVFDLV